ncbi:hypothetical protein SPURM210S_07241 [Streptomyces purpurascens]
MTDQVENSEQEPLSKIDTSVPHSARIWNYWLGGKDNYEVDRVAGDAFREIFPGIETGARAARYFLARAVRHLAAEEGIRQFLDIGTGLPNVDNTHQIASGWLRQSRIVYVDTTRWCWPTPARCSPAHRKASPTTSTPTCASRARSSGKPARRLTSTSPSRSC